MDSSRSSISLSPVLNPGQKGFAFSLNNFIEEELRLIDSNDKNENFLSRERYLVFREAFAKIISYLQAYKALLSNIKKEYELFIDELEKNQLEFNNAQDEMIKLKSTNLTIFNLETRKSELKKQLSAIKNENERLKSSLNSLTISNEKHKKNQNQKYAFLSVNENKNRSDVSMKTQINLIPGLTLDKSIDLDYLNNLLSELENKINDLTNSQAKKYTNKEQKIELERNLFEKIQSRDNAQIESIRIKNKINLYRYALKAAKDYYNGHTRYNGIQDALSRGLINSYLNKNPKVDDDNDNLYDNSFDESEFILEFIEKFNDLFESGCYTEAAHFAAASPRKYISDNKDCYTEDTDPLLVYCNSIIDSTNDASTKPNAEMSIECIRVALKYNRIDLLTRWIAQRRITFHYQAAQLIEEYARLKAKNSKNSFELALFIYTEMKAPLDATICMAKLGRLSSMIDFIRSQKNLNSNEVYFKILKECPSVELATEIMDINIIENLQIPVDRIVSILLDSDQPENGLKFLKIQIQKSSIYDENDENLKKLKASYETLVKFSFLAQDDEHFTKETALKTRDHLLNIYSVPKEHITVRCPQEADFGIEKLPKLARHPHRVHKSPHEIINETDETKTSIELDQNEELKDQQHIFSEFHKERKLSYLMEDKFLIKEEDEPNEDNSEKEEDEDDEKIENADG